MDSGHTVELFEDAAGEWRWHRKAENGEIVADSGEGYANRGDALAQVKQQFPDDQIVEESRNERSPE